MTEIYYEKQDGWTKDDFFYLHRVLHRMFFYYKKHSDEIKKMDVSKMSDKTQVLIKCIIGYYNYDFLFDEYNNIRPIKNVHSLREALVIDDNPLPEDNIYKKMNVVY